MACEVCLEGIDCRLKLPRVGWLRDFAVVATCGSFAGAGRELGRTGDSVWQTVAMLERHLGAKLFARSRATVRLTDMGRALLPSVLRSLRLLSAVAGR